MLKTSQILVLTIILCLISQAVFAGNLSRSLTGRVSQGEVADVDAIVFLQSDPVEIVSLQMAAKSIKGFKDRYALSYRSINSSSEASIRAFQDEVTESEVPVQLLKTFAMSRAALVRVSVADLSALSRLESVEYIVEDTLLELVSPVGEPQLSSAVAGVEPNLAAINADKLWKMGITGVGRHVMSFDTGVDGAHPGLASRWRGLSTGDPSASWFDPFGTSFPEDNAGHGTHVMGLMGGVFEGDTVGVAPDVEWSCAAVVDRGAGFSQTISDILSAFDWAANPDGDPETTDDVPDAICHSWGIPKGVFAPCDNTFWQAIDNLEQLGVVNVFACGNEGPDPMSIRNPADRASSPLNAFSVGAVDHRIADFPVASFSSRGPANCDSTEIKPEVVAPGVLIKSLKPGGTTRIMSGTSMASPQVAGAVALLRQYNPDATVEQIKHALMMSARDIDAEGEDNNSGFGMLDLERAIDFMPSPEHAFIAYDGFDVEDGGNNIIEPNEEVELWVHVEISAYDVDGLYGVLESYNPDVEILVDSALFGSLPTGISTSNQQQPFVIRAAEIVCPGSRVTFRVDFFDESGEFLNNAYFEAVIGQNGSASAASITNGMLSVGSCNFGSVGLGNGAIVDMNQSGFMLDSIDYMPEFALVMASSDGNVSDAARSSTGHISDNDLLAVDGSSLEVEPAASWGDYDINGEYTDDLAETPMGLHVEQRVSLFNDLELETVAFVTYRITALNHWTSDVIVPGIVFDIDFPGESSGLDMYGVDELRGLVYYFNSALDSYVGVGFVSGSLRSAVSFANSFDSKAGLSDSVKSAAMWSTTVSSSPSKRADYSHLISTQPVTPSSDGYVEIAAVIVWAPTELELMNRFDAAYVRYNVTTAAGDVEEPIIPAGFELSQNYPNPFNPSTTIRYSVETAQDVELSIYNILGQKVHTLVNDHVAAGTHEAVWDGTDNSGAPAASGVYFYKLTTGSSSATRKMMLLK